MDIFKIAALCITAVFVIVLFTQYKKEYAAVTAIAVGSAVLIICFSTVINPLYTLLEYIEKAGIDRKYFTAALKSVALGIITQFVGDTCRDFGCGSIAAKAELAGKVSIFLICLPLIEELFAVIIKLL